MSKTRARMTMERMSSMAITGSRKIIRMNIWWTCHIVDARWKSYIRVGGSQLKWKTTMTNSKNTTLNWRWLRILYQRWQHWHGQSTLISWYHWVYLWNLWIHYFLFKDCHILWFVLKYVIGFTSLRNFFCILKMLILRFV